jgi:hypothetical protein
MKLKMLIGLAGRDFSLAPNEETERFSGAEAARLVEAGYAEAVRLEPAASTTRPAPVQKTTKAGATEKRG